MSKKNTEGLRFLHLELENFKNIDKKVVDIGGKSILIMGRNGSGKSSLIQAMMSPLDSKILPSETVKQGEEKASIEVTIGGTLGGEQKKYIVSMYFTKNNQKGRIVVTNEKGETQKSPATFIKSLIGNVSFDITKWMNESKEKKLAILKKLTGSDQKIDIINNEIKDLKTTKKYRQQRSEDLEATIANNGYTKEEIDSYSEPIDIKPLQEELSAVSKAIENWNTVESKIRDCEKTIQSNNNDINKALNEIMRLEQMIQKEKEKIDDLRADNEKQQNNIHLGNEWINQKKSKPSVDAINEKIQIAIAHNENHNKIKQLADYQREIIKSKQEIEDISTAISKKEKERSDIISSSQLPIPGLSFTDEEIFIDNLPLEDGQINTARIFDIGVDVAMAMHPNLKTIFLHDGSLFDKESLHKIVEKIENMGYQAIIEMVDADGGDLEVKFTETAI